MKEQREGDEKQHLNGKNDRLMEDSFLLGDKKA